MTTEPPNNEFDVHAVRHQMKLVKDAGHTKLFENRDDVSCPACGDSFAELLLTENRTYRLDPPSSVSVCVVREDGRLLLASHQ